jgi:predicted alpha-1,2-mannosidase
MGTFKKINISDFQKIMKLLFVCLIIIFSGPAYAEKDLVNFVNTLQGTNSKFELTHGNTYPTLAMPWGMNFWTPQTGVNRDGWIYQYAKDSIRGFRQTHQCSSWTRDYAAFSLMPVSGTLAVNQFKRALKFTHEKEIAKPNYYRVTFENKITTEMSPTERGVYFRFSFPKGKDSYIVIDANSGGSMVKIFPEQRKIVGYCKNANRSVPKEFANYFVAYFDKPFVSYGTWKNAGGELSPDNTEADGDYVGAYIRFKQGVTAEVRIASSFISLEQAELNLQQELAGFKSLEDVKINAANAWNKQLGKIEVEGGTPEEKATFYSCFFRSMLFPRQFFEYNADKQPIYYSPYDGKIHNGYMYTDTGFWDTFRAQFPLNILLHPEMHGRYVKSLVDAYEQSNWLPSWAFPGHNDGMVGNHAASLLADAWVKGLKTFDPLKALEAMYHEATNKGPYGPSNGRDGWKEYFSIGYVPYPEYREAVAKTLEFCYDDFCAMQVARLSGLSFYEEIFKRQIFNYKNVYDPSTRFMRGRNSKGEWVSGFDPIEWGGAYTEGSAWHYHWSVFHDIQGLINLMGGDKNFVAKLDSVFSESNKFKVGTYGRVIHEMTEMAMINMGQYAHGNQPIQHMIYLYNYAGEPWKTQKWVRQVMNKLYNSGPDGYPGDEDQGQTSSWYVISAMGLYSVCPGTDQYVIGSPVFPKMTVHLENGKTLEILADNNSLDNRYIQSATLNGKTITRTWLTYNELMAGGTIRYVMNSNPSTTRGILPEDRPFSVSKK